MSQLQELKALIFDIERNVEQQSQMLSQYKMKLNETQAQIEGALAGSEMKAYNQMMAQLEETNKEIDSTMAHIAEARSMIAHFKSM